MKILETNSVNFGSTGNIMLQIAEKTRKKGHCVYTSCAYGRSTKTKDTKSHIYIGNSLSRNIHSKLGFLTGFHGCFSIISTLNFLRKVDKIKPNIIHIHNIHSDYINIHLLFKYIKKRKIKTIWTLHDCWAFTGHCPYFDIANCNKWKLACCDCPQYRNYPSSFFDDSKKMHKLKKKWFTGVNDMTLVTPSKWLCELVKESFLKEYPVQVINNGINLSVFKPTYSDFRKKYNCENKFLLLGVAFGWGERKGLDVFIELSKRLDSEKYQIVLVGTTNEIDKRLPRSIISIHRTQNQQELAEIYTAADLFVNPTREEVFGLVNAEALACGTPIVTFKTGGSPEVIDHTCGCVVEKNDINALISKVLYINKEKPYGEQNCVKRAKQFDKNNKFEEYMEIYEL